MIQLKKTRHGGKWLPTMYSNLSEMFDLNRILEEPHFNFPIWNGAHFFRIPAVNIKEEEDAYVIEMAAPGLEKQDFQVDIDHRNLEIKVIKEEEETKGAKQPRFARREYNYNNFCRRFYLPDSVDTEKIKAEYVNGLMKVNLPKKEPAKKQSAKEISVK